MATKRLRISFVALAAIAAIFIASLAAASSSVGQPDTSQAADTAPALGTDTTGTNSGYAPVINSNRSSGGARVFDRVINLEDELDPDEEPDVNLAAHSRVVIGPTSVRGGLLAGIDLSVGNGTPEEDCWNVARLIC